jgi:hypothetical protein
VALPVAASDVAVVAQALLALALIVVGAEVFVETVGHTAETIGLPAELAALILAPLATELPEKINSILRVARREGHPGPRQHHWRDGLPEHRTRDVRHPVRELGARAAQPLLRGVGSTLRWLDLRDALARCGAPLVAPDGQRGLLPRLLRCRCVRGYLIAYSTGRGRSARDRARQSRAPFDHWGIETLCGARSWRAGGTR